MCVYIYICISHTLYSYYMSYFVTYHHKPQLGNPHFWTVSHLVILGMSHQLLMASWEQIEIVVYWIFYSGLKWWHTLQETNISHLGKRKIIFKSAFKRGRVFPRWWHQNSTGRNFHENSQFPNCCFPASAISLSHLGPRLHAHRRGGKKGSSISPAWGTWANRTIRGIGRDGAPDPNVGPRNGKSPNIKP